MFEELNGRIGSGAITNKYQIVFLSIGLAGNKVRKCFGVHFWLS